MKVWYDACTGKHVRYGVAIAKRLRSLGYEVLLTTRNHPDTLALAELLKEKLIPVGEYDPTSLYTRLRKSAKRVLKLAELINDSPPDLAISHQSVELCRVAFGLNIPIILTADTPHATAVNKLTIPLAEALVVSEAIPKSFFARFGRPKIFQFKGVDEVAWIKDINKSKNFEFKKPLIIVRQLEIRASYASGKVDVTEKIAKKLAKIGNVLFITRYSRQSNGENVLNIPEEFIDVASLVCDADLVVSAGGTIAREAALQGIPSIVISDFGETYVNRYLSEKGFPLYIVRASKVLDLAKTTIGKRYDVKEKLMELENPVDLLERIISQELFKETKE
ncbi:MAG: DUF354 domain-containing protein [Candidatus Bathyarchaeia archaeon]